MKRIIISFVILLFAVTAWGQSGSTTKSFSWHGLTINYPANYIITDKEYDRQNKTYSFICTITGNDTVSMIAIGFSKKLAKDLSNSLSRKIFFKEIIPATISELEPTFKSIKTSDIREYPIPYPNVSVDYTAFVENVEIQGKIVFYIQNDLLISAVITADSPQYMQELEEILKSVTIK